MPSITWSITVGIISGLLTAVILLILRNLFFDSFLPWYRQIMYKGVDLNGSWFSYSNAQKTLLELKQHSDTISGKATVQLMKEFIPEKHIEAIHIDDIRTFDIEGDISERFVHLKLRHTDRNRLGMLILLLQVEGDGTKLTGQGCWYSPGTSTIMSGKRTFHRDETRAKKSINKKRNVEFELSEKDNNENEEDS